MTTGSHHASAMTQRDEGELPDLDAEIEEQERERNRVLRQADLAERAGEAEAMQQAEREGHEPRPARRQARPAAARVHDLDGDEHDRQAIVASTGRPGTWTKPSVAAASVMLCAMVNAVTVMATRRHSRTRMTSARTNSR